MKKSLIAMLLALSMCFVGCSNQSVMEDDEEILEELEDEDEELAGGWNIVDAPQATLSEEDMQMFNYATMGNVSPVALLGTQVVSGTNYCFLAKNVNYQIVIIYKDINGNVSLLNDVDFNCHSKKFVKDNEDVVDGGWQVAEQTYANPSKEEYEVFNPAVEGLIGTKYELIATLETQVVAGMNYCFIAKSSVETDDPEGYYDIVLIFAYQDLNGNVELTDVVTMDLGYFNQ